MPIDVNLLREEKGGDPALVRRSEEERGRDPAVVDDAVAADRCWRECLFKLEQLKRQLNSVNKALGEEKKKQKQQQQELEQPQQTDGVSPDGGKAGKGGKAGSREAELIQEALYIRDIQLPSAAAAAATADRRRESLLHRIGNILHASVPVALCESKNAIVRTWGLPLPSVAASSSPAAAVGAAAAVAVGKEGLLHHHQILSRLGGVEFRKGVEVAGHRGYFLKGPGFLFNMALAQYGINFLLRKGYTPVQPPFFMRREVMARAAELKDFEETLYRIPHNSTTAETANPSTSFSSSILSGAATSPPAAAAVSSSAAVAASPSAAAPASPQHQGGEDRDDLFLIATSEQPLCALHRGQVIEEKQLPIKYAGYSSCFRKEAGAHGKDCWGIFRIHQFEKVEQFCLCGPEQSWRMHEEMITVAEEFYQSLDLPYRLVSIVSGALNDAAAKKYDLEAWFPARGEYRELVSCSNCTDYQSRALEIRMQPQQQHKKKELHCSSGNKNAEETAANATAVVNSSSHRAAEEEEEKKKQLQPEAKPFVHMLNGTLVATQRCLCCVLENYQTPTGVKVPRVLQPYMGGVEFLPYEADAADAAAETKKSHKREA